MCRQRRERLDKRLIAPGGSNRRRIDAAFAALVQDSALEPYWSALTRFFISGRRNKSLRWLHAIAPGNVRAARDRP